MAVGVVVSVGDVGIGVEVADGVSVGGAGVPTGMLGAVLVAVLVGTVGSNARLHGAGVAVCEGGLEAGRKCSGTSATITASKFPSIP